MISNLTVNVNNFVLTVTWQNDGENTTACGETVFTVQVNSSDGCTVQFHTPNLCFTYPYTLIPRLTFRVKVTAVTETGTEGDPLVAEHVAGKV